MHVQSIGARAAAGLWLCAVGSAAYAQCQTTTFAREGVWRAYGGPCNDGTKMCGIATQGQGKYFGIKFFSGDNYFTVQLGADSWRIRDGATQRVMLEIDNYGPWSATATGMHFSDGDAGLEFRVPGSSLDQFMSEFRQGRGMAVRFPGARDVAGWTVRLEGSNNISSSFLSCIRAM
jgi:hypothetical protein